MSSSKQHWHRDHGNEQSEYQDRPQGAGPRFRTEADRHREQLKETACQAHDQPEQAFRHRKSALPLDSKGNHSDSNHRPNLYIPLAHELSDTIAAGGEGVHERPICHGASTLAVACDRSFVRGPPTLEP